MSLDVNTSEPDEFNCHELHSCISSVANSTGIEDFKYNVDYICGKGENYIANIFRVFIIDSKKDETVSVIVKTLVNTVRQELFYDLHEREVKVYQNVVPYYKIIQADIDEDERIGLPKCMYSSLEKAKEVLILEDMDMLGYKKDSTLSRYENLDFLQVRTVIIGLAKFHGLSIIFERQYPELFSKCQTEFEDVIFQEKFLNKSKIRNYLTDSFELSLGMVSDVGIKKKLEFIQTHLVELLRSYTKPRKYNVLCHGDFWINNVMFNYQEKKITKLCILDFQAMRYASPATDLIYFLYLCTESKFRSEYLNILTDIYYDTLKSFLDKYKIDVNEIFPKEEFDSEIDEMLPFGLLMAMVQLRTLSATPEEDNISRGSAFAFSIENLTDVGESQMYKYRVNNLVNEFVQNGNLDKLLENIKT